MNFDSEIKSMQQAIEENTATLNSLVQKHDAAKQFTEKYLNECAKVGITKTAIGRTHKSVKSCEGWRGGYGMVFGIGPKDEQGWPAIWGVCERLKISKGCGNPGQHQADTTNLIDGVYHLRGGKWTRISEQV